MAKVVYGKDVGFECEGVVRANSEDRALEMVAEHARTVHGVERVTPEVAQKVRSVMRDERDRAC